MKNRLFVILSLIVAFSLLLAACGPANTNTAAEETTSEEVEVSEENSEAEVTDEAESTEEETAEETSEEVEVSSEPTKVVFALSEEPDSLDPHVTARAVAVDVMNYIGGTLIAVNAEGDVIPYLAESWEISEDGLTYTFHLRDDVLFHNGDPLTAQDFVYTFERAIDPELASPVAGTLLVSTESFEAVDDTTFVIHMLEPFYPFLYALAGPYLQPISRAYLEEVGKDEMGRSPIGVGPYKFSEWQTGDRIVLEANPDYIWGPEEFGSGPFQIDTVEYRIIPEPATIIAGLEASEIDYAGISVNELGFFEALPFDILETPIPGNTPQVSFNVTAAPFDNINVRIAMNMAVDRQVILDVLNHGSGEIMYGPLSSSVIGYWEGVEEYGYPYDPEGAQALLEEEGYALNADGIYEKDGVPMSFILKCPAEPTNVKFAEMVQSMMADIGIEIEIRQEDMTVLVPELFGGDYELTVLGYGYTDSDILYLVFHSSQVGSLNWYQVNSPELDELLELTRTLIDPEDRQQAVNDAQKMITENAYFIAAVATNSYQVISQKVKGYSFSSLTGLLLNQAYIE